MPKDPSNEFVNELVNTYRYMMFKIAKGILCNDFLAEDAVQNAFLHIINNPDKILEIPVEKRGGYLNRTVTNACYDLIRKEKQKNECNIDDFEICSDSLDDEILSALTVEEIRTLLNELPERDQEILYLYLFNDYAPKEIAKNLHIPKRQISTYIERARKRLIKLLEERGYHYDV